MATSINIPNIDVSQLDEAQKKNYKQTYEKELKRDQNDMESYQEDLNEIAAALVKQGIPLKTVQSFVNAGEIVYYNGSSPEDVASNSGILTQLLNQDQRLSSLIEPLQGYGLHKYNVDKIQAFLNLLDSTPPKQEASSSKYVEKPEPDSAGHLYPVGLVTRWTNKLNYWNAQLDGYIEKIEALDINVDITWLCKKCEFICRKINYALAMIRYQIIKNLSGIFAPAQEFKSMITSVTQVSITDPFSVVSWALNVVKFFMKPYTTIIQFISDFMSYTPPLVSAATSLVGKAASIPGRILNRIDIVAKDKDGTQKEIADVYKQYLDIHMDPITLGDLMGGSPGAKPQMAEYSANKDQYDLLQSKKDKALNDIGDWAVELSNIFVYTDGLERVVAKYPGTITTIPEEPELSYYVEKKQSVLDYRETALFVYEIAKGEEKNEKAKQKAIEKAQKAQELAKRNEELAAKDILDDASIQEALKAQEEADQALKEAQSMDTKIKIPWDTPFKTSRYKVYPMLSTAFICQCAQDDDDLWDMVLKNVINYYKGMYCKNQDSGMVKDGQPYVDFVKAYSSVFPKIPDCLNKLVTLVQQYDEADRGISSLNKRSVFK